VRQVLTVLRHSGSQFMILTILLNVCGHSTISDFFFLLELSQSGYDIVGVDWTIDPLIARKQSGGAVTLQGNLDPCALYAPDDQLRAMAVNMAKSFGKKGYIANLGHGIYPDADPDKVKVLIDAVHSV